MADVRPFRGLRYDLGQIKDLSLVITPPYDVISPEQQEGFHRRHPLNIIRLEFGRDAPGDDASENKYTRAARTFADWTRRGILTRESRPAFYLTEHRFPFSNGYRSYWGLIAAVRLEPFDTGRIRPTEIIMKGPAADRMNLLRSCRANFSPIMGIFDGMGGSLRSLTPDIDPSRPDLTASDDAGVAFNVWIMTDESLVERVSRFFAERTLYIADGHHRYTTALAFREERRGECPSEEDPSNFLMMTLISSSDPGLTLLPTHRMLKGLSPQQMARLEEGLQRHFEIRELPVPGLTRRPDWLKSVLEEGPEGTPLFGLYGGSSNAFRLLFPRDLPALRAMLPPEKPAPWRALDVSLLHGVVFHHLLGIGGAEGEKEHLDYSPNEAEIISRVDSGKAQAAFFLRPVPVSSVIAVAEAGVRMPPKSTYFYPKTPAGLVINPLF